MLEERISEQTLRLGKAFTVAVAEAIAKAGSQKKLSDAIGIHQSRISDYVNGNYDFSNLTIGTLIRLFPELEIMYFSDSSSLQKDDAITVMEQRMLLLFRRLSVNDKVLCYENMAKTYGDTFRDVQKSKEMKKNE